METIKNIIQTAGTAVSGVAEALTSDKKTAELQPEMVDESKAGTTLTTNFGVPLSDTDNSLKAGNRGPTLMEDFHFREKVSHFDHERIPERAVHARGAGAFGYFQVHESLADITCADFLCNPQKKTPVFVRFSTVLGSRGSTDTPRDVRGFAVKFYTDEGNFDLVGNNIPVFFIQDAIKFPDLIHAGKPEPHNEIPQAQTAHDNFWDFIGLTHESTHMIMWALSDRALPRSFRMMQGFGVHTFVLVNKEGKRRFVKFHWTPKLGTHSLVWDECVKMSGVDPDFQRRDLFDAIESGSYPEWTLGIQVVEEEDEHKFDFDLLDATKIIPEEIVPVRKVGTLVLNRNPNNFFAETEQVAYCTSHLVPGIEASNDPLLQGRMFSYQDTQLTRLGGPNFEEIPINRPVCPVTNNQRDGFHRMQISQSKVNYFPNRFGCPAVSKTGYRHTPDLVNGPKIRARGPKFDEHYKQARLFFNSLSTWERLHLIQAAKFELGHCDDQGVQERIIDMLNHVDFEMAREVAESLGLDPPAQSKQVQESRKSPALSQDNSPKDSIQTRKIAFLVGRGYSSVQLKAVRTYLESMGAITELVGPNKGEVPSDAGDTSFAKWSYLTCRSVIFDAVVVVGGKPSHIAQLKNVGEASSFVTEAYKHCKPVAAIAEGVDFLEGLPLFGLKSSKGPEVVSHQGVVTLRGFTETSVVPNQKEGGDSPFSSSLYQAIAAHRHHDRDVSKVPA